MSENAPENLETNSRPQLDPELIRKSLADEQVRSALPRDLETADAGIPIRHSTRELRALSAVADLAVKESDLCQARNLAILDAYRRDISMEKIAEAAGTSRQNAYRWARRADPDSTIKTFEKRTARYWRDGDMAYLRCEACRSTVSGWHAYHEELQVAMLGHWGRREECVPNEHLHESPRHPDSSTVAPLDWRITTLLQQIAGNPDEDEIDKDASDDGWSDEVLYPKPGTLSISDALSQVSGIRTPSEDGSKLVSKLAMSLADRFVELDERSERMELEENVLFKVEVLAKGARDLLLALDLGTWRAFKLEIPPARIAKMAGVTAPTVKRRSHKIEEIRSLAVQSIKRIDSFRSRTYAQFYDRGPLDASDAELHGMDLDEAAAEWLETETEPDQGDEFDREWYNFITDAYIIWHQKGKGHFGWKMSNNWPPIWY